jgi:hypothetical protein
MFTIAEAMAFQIGLKGSFPKSELKENGLKEKLKTGLACFR